MVKNMNLFLIIGFILVITFFISVEGICAEERVIFVNGNGEVSIKPDIAEINITTKFTDKSQLKAGEENAKKMNRLLDGLREWGIKEEDITTSNIGIGEVYNYNDGKRELVGYEAYNNINVTLRNLDKIGEVLDLSLKLGADEIGTVNYKSSREKEAYNEALGLSVKSARSKADAIAKALGVKIKEAIKVEEISNGYYRDNTSIMYSKEVLDNENQTPIIVDDLRVRANLNIGYSY